MNKFIIIILTALFPFSVFGYDKCIYSYDLVNDSYTVSNIEEEEEKNINILSYVNFIKSLYPYQILKKIPKLNLCTDNKYGYKGKVVASVLLGKKNINIDYRDFPNLNNDDLKKHLIGVLMHELGHLIFLDENQLSIIKIFNGTNKYKRILIPKRGSYKELFLNKFYIEKGINKLSYISRYSSYHIDEDMAEVFMNFILLDVKSIFDKNIIKEDAVREKLLFYYNYSEIVRMRIEIRNKLLKFGNFGSKDLLDIFYLMKKHDI